MIQKQRFAFNFFLCGGLLFFWIEKKPLNLRLKISHFIVSFFPPSKSYERVFINDWGAASLDKCKMLHLFYFFLVKKHLFIFWNVPINCSLTEPSSGGSVSAWLGQHFCFVDVKKRQGIKLFIFFVPSLNLQYPAF